MSDTPTTPTTSTSATATPKIDPKVIAGGILLGLAIGTLVGMKLAKAMMPPPLPHRGPCPECEQRRLRDFPPSVVPHPEQVVVTPPAPAPAPEPTSAPVTFSAQAIPDAAPSDA